MSASSGGVVSSVVFTHDGSSASAAFDYEVSDTDGDTDVGTVTVVVSNPLLRVVQAVDDVGPNVVLGQSVTMLASALLQNDVGSDGSVGGEELTVTVVRAPRHGTVSLDGTSITFTHDGVASPSDGYAFTYEVFDGSSGSSDTAIVSGAVSAPGNVRAVDDPGPTVAMGASVTISAATLLSNDVASDGNTGSAALAVTVVSSPGRGTVRLDGTRITFTHDGTSAPSEGYMFTYKVTYGLNGSTDTAFVTGPVTSPIPPLLLRSVDAVDDEGPNVVLGRSVSIPASFLLSNDVDSDRSVGSELMAVTEVGYPQRGKVTLKGTVVTITHDGTSSVAAGYAFTYRVTDKINGTTDAAYVSGKVMPPGARGNVNANEDEGPAVEVGRSISIASINLLANDVDSEGNVASDTLAVTEVSSPVHGTVSLDGSRITFPHDGVAAAAEGYSFAYDATDRRNGTKDTAHVIGSVTLAPPLPSRSVKVVDDAGPNIAMGASVSIPTSLCLVNDVDSAGNVGSTTLTVTAITHTQRGKVSLDESAITFTHDGTSAPAAGYAFIYEVTDAINGTTDTAVVWGKVESRVPPGIFRNVDALDDEGPSVSAGERVPIPVSLLLKNDIDSTGNGGSDKLSVTAVSFPQHRTVKLDGDTIAFTHDGTSAARDGYAFAYEVTDGINGSTDTALVSGTVTVPVPPRNAEAVDDEGPPVEVDGSVSISVATLLVNDVDSEGSVGSDELESNRRQVASTRVGEVGSQ